LDERRRSIYLRHNCMEPYSELVLEKAMRRRELENTDAVGNAAACIGA